LVRAGKKIINTLLITFFLLLFIYFLIKNSSLRDCSIIGFMILGELVESLIGLFSYSYYSNLSECMHSESRQNSQSLNHHSNPTSNPFENNISNNQIHYDRSIDASNQVTASVGTKMIESTTPAVGSTIVANSFAPEKITPTQSLGLAIGQVTYEGLKNLGDISKEGKTVEEVTSHMEEFKYEESKNDFMFQ